MSLYDDLDINDKPGGGGKDTRPDVYSEFNVRFSNFIPLRPRIKAGWGSRMKLMETQKHLHAKKASLTNVKKRQTTVAPVVDLRRRNEDCPLHFNMITGKLEKMPSLPSVTTPLVANEAPTASVLFVTDEYDPLKPNEYEDWVTKMRQRRREEEKKKEGEDKERKRKEKEEEDEQDRRRRKRDSDEEEEYERPKRTGGAAIAPPMSLIEEDKVKENDDGVKLNLATAMEQVQLPVPGAGVDQPGFSFSSAKALKMMTKMGYKQGSGLGKLEQGMSVALQVEKTSKRGGKIIHEKDIPKVTEPPRADVSNIGILKNPSKVLLLRNMVGPGEVDEDLEAETTEECQKYGKVVKCVIFEIPGVEEEEAVRIFLEFERVESSIKGAVDLNGRFFGGRIVKASFYNLDKFRRLDLADPVD